ncbi:hypothetical protein CGMCC3_g6231 [Colletotrichum fructicola]|nr:uncharacterized protein CGMCC3_g6231 [Colletotrichum fructicola]KAE9577832.1 hypothetical protein CGMCC3_g6231 [Colletotrichum fructicola]
MCIDDSRLILRKFPQNILLDVRYAFSISSRDKQVMAGPVFPRGPQQRTSNFAKIDCWWVFVVGIKSKDANKNNGIRAVTSL